MTKEIFNHIADNFYFKDSMVYLLIAGKEYEVDSFEEMLILNRGYSGKVENDYIYFECKGSCYCFPIDIIQGIRIVKEYGKKQ